MVAVIKYILVALIVGAFAGYLDYSFLNLTGSSLVSAYLFNASLFLLLFVMGLTLSLDKEAIGKIRKSGLRILIVPFSVAAGSILGGFVAGLVLRLDVFASMAVTAGCGWYTLTGPLVGDLFGLEWGAMGFAVNFMRELFTIVGVSLLIRIDKYGPIASGGATSMDTTLPIIVRYSGSDVLITAFSSGFVLTLIAPFMIIMIATLG